MPSAAAAMRRYIIAVGLLVCASCAPGPTQVPLNSEQILARYGSYGVDVLYADEHVRLSSLYSEDSGKTTRTFAIVEFAAPVHPELADAHARVVAGGSIGAVFRSDGWSIRKKNIFAGDLDLDVAPQAMFDLMQTPPVKSLATHVYEFVVENESRSASYATIVEIHHPDYLNAQRLRQTYGIVLQENDLPHALSEFTPSASNALQEIETNFRGPSPQ